MGVRSIRAVLYAMLFSMLAGSGVAQAAAPVIAAASSLKFALEEVAATYHQQQGRKLRLVFGSSGNFYRQIRQGAPFELFLSADEQYVQKLNEAGLTDGAGEVYAVGRLAYFAPKGSPLSPEAGLEGLKHALRDGKVRRFAIANPDHAPYGRVAMEALSKAGLAESIEPHLILGENVTQAAQFAISGSTQGGLIAYSLALSPPISAKGTYQLVSESLHQPLRQRMVLLEGASETARDFFLYLQTAEARKLLAGYGFLLPDKDH